MSEHSTSARAAGTGRRHRPLRLLTAIALASALLGSAASAASAAVAVPASAGSLAAAANPYERGPAPTNASIEATTGPFATATTTVSPSSVSGFGGGTIYYPTSTSAGTFGAIAISPGYFGPQFSIAWYGPRIASQGFVVFTIDTLSLTDSADSRATQLLAALDYLTGTSTVKSRIDASRLGVMGHSLGGGGSLVASATRPSLKASIPLTPYHDRKDFSTVRTPTLIIGAENDTTAPVAEHSVPFYNSLPSSTNKAFLDLNNGVHTTPITSNVTIAKYSISWLKRFIDDDTRYEQFLCPLPSGPAIQEYRGNCPHT